MNKLELYRKILEQFEAGRSSYLCNIAFILGVDEPNSPYVEWLQEDLRKHFGCHHDDLNNGIEYLLLYQQRGKEEVWGMPPEQRCGLAAALHGEGRRLRLEFLFGKIKELEDAAKDK